jgi:hypothetical protein
MSGKAACIGGPPLTKQEAQRFEHNVALMSAHHAETREPVVWLRVYFDGTEWRTLEVVEPWDGIAKIREQFLQHRNQILAPGVRGRGTLIGALMHDDSRYHGEGVPAAPPNPQAPVVPTPPLPPEPEPATAPAVSRLSPKKIKAAIARAKKVIAKGADRAAVIEHLRTAFGIETTEI